MTSIETVYNKSMGIVEEKKLSKDEEACLYAEKEDTLETWESYVEEFPKGSCSFKAKSKVKTLKKSAAKETKPGKKGEENDGNEADKSSCEYARNKNTEKMWKEYLKSFPKGRCALEAKDKLEEIRDMGEAEAKEAEAERAAKQEKKPRKSKKSQEYGGLQWSKKAWETMTWDVAKEYCADLEEGGYSDWHLPTISELRTIIINCPGSETGGDCRVKAPGCLSESCWRASRCSCDGSADSYSALGDGKEIALWSSSVQSDDAEHAWYVYFYFGNVYNHYMSSKKFVKCVR